MKQVAVSILGSGELLDRTIAPGTTAGDLLRDVNLPNGLLSKSREGEFFANSDPIYDKITDGQKLFASTPASVGSSFFEALVNKALSAFDGKYFPKTKIDSGIGGGALRRPSRLVQRQQIPYWQERGWTRKGRSYRGNYITPYGAYSGWISQPGFSEIKFHIQHPPDCVFNSSHAGCFQSSGSGDWFSIHMSRRPQDVSSGILAIEHLISDCFRNRG